MMPESDWAIGPGGAVAIAAAILVALVALIRFTHYRLGRHEVEVLFLRLVIRKVPLNNIDDVIIGSRFPCEFWPSRWMFSGRALTIRRKRGLLRYLTIIPPDAEKLRVNIYYALGWKP